MTLKRFYIFLVLIMITPVLASASDGIIVKRTWVLSPGEYPAAIRKHGPQEGYLLFRGNPVSEKDGQGDIFRKDTIINLKKFLSKFPATIGYRLLFGEAGSPDSVWQTNKDYRVTDKAYPMGTDLLRVVALDDEGAVIHDFAFNFRSKVIRLNENKQVDAPSQRILGWLLRQYEVYDSYDRANFSVASAWVLSIGIDDYGKDKFRTCKTDARSYAAFFREQYGEKVGSTMTDQLVHEYTLTDEMATKDSILAVLKEIARLSTAQDYFIFNFSGVSNKLPGTAEASGTYFFPWDVVLSDNQWEGAKILNRNKQDSTAPYRNCISLRVLQEHIQAIPAINQLFISEAGPTEKFRTEFIRTIMQNSPEVARILDKNRVIIVPNGFGYDGVSCNGRAIMKGPINYYITSLEAGNIFDLFNDDSKATQLAYLLRNKAWSCESFKEEYFDIFFERKFLREYEELLSGTQGSTRGLKPETRELKKLANLSGKSYALVVGTNEYKGNGWKKLPNAIHDAREISRELEESYGFEVQLLEDKPIDSIYKALTEYYRMLHPDDQLILYFAGHGDMETEFMDDGFIVCADSKSREDDPTRNTYIQYVKLQKMVNKIPARQILVMLDVCHGGVFNQKRSDPVRTIANRNVHQFLTDQAAFTCRKFLSSVGTDEAFDGKPGEHSPFANLLLQVLRAKGNSSNGIVTLSNIYSVLQTASMNETATLKISPQKDGFGKDNPESEFILIPVERNKSDQ